MENILRRIVEKKRERIPRGRDFHSAFVPRRGAFLDALGAAGISFICEYKKASPSRGVIRDDISPEETVRLYERGGADAVSVLTEEDFFGGSIEHLRRVRETTGLPLLRKDFIFHPFQVEETAAAGADCILLIAAVLGEDLGAFVEMSRTCGLAVLVEVHDGEEMERALAADADVIGVNNRDLETFAVSLETTARLAPLVPEGRLCISESGVRGPEDVAFLASCGVDGILVGEALMRSRDIPGTLAALKGKGCT